jgi:hypothetical protein
MKFEANIAPPNSIVFVMDAKNEDTPVTMDTSLVVSTPSCIVVGTYPEPDGKTTIILTDDPSGEIGPGDALAFTGSIRVAGRVLSVVTAYGDVILAMPVRNQDTHVRVWADDPECPSRIIIAAA